MDIKTLSSFFQDLSPDKMSLLYSGTFSDEVTSQIIGLTGAQFDDGSDMNRMQKKTGFLIAECFQNIVRHNESSVENGYFLTRNDNDALYIASGNIVANQMIDALSEKLNHLNTLTKEALKEIYLKTLSNQEISEKGGAGLGLIEMARKTGNQLAFEFVKINEKYSYFYFQIKFNASKDDQTADEQHSITKSIDLRQKMLNEHIFLIYQGDVSMDTVLPIISMVEKSLAYQEIVTIKKVILVLVEFLQNMSKHGATYNDDQNGLLLLGEKDGKYLIGGSNFVYLNEVESFKHKLDKYMHMDLENLNLAYKHILKHGDPKNENGSSLGLIEMARRSSVPIEYDFQKTNDSTALFTMLIQI